MENEKKKFWLCSANIAWKLRKWLTTEWSPAWLLPMETVAWWLVCFAEETWAEETLLLFVSFAVNFVDGASLLYRPLISIPFNCLEVINSNLFINPFGNVFLDGGFADSAICSYLLLVHAFPPILWFTFPFGNEVFGGCFDDPLLSCIVLLVSPFVLLVCVFPIALLGLSSCLLLSTLITVITEARESRLLRELVLLNGDRHSVLLMGSTTSFWEIDLFRGSVRAILLIVEPFFTTWSFCPCFGIFTGLSMGFGGFGGTTGFESFISVVLFFGRMGGFMFTASFPVDWDSGSTDVFATFSEPFSIWLFFFDFTGGWTFGFSDFKVSEHVVVTFLEISFWTPTLDASNFLFTCTSFLLESAIFTESELFVVELWWHVFFLRVSFPEPFLDPMSSSLFSNPCNWFMVWTPFCTIFWLDPLSTSELLLSFWLIRGAGTGGTFCCEVEFPVVCRSVDFPNALQAVVLCSSKPLHSFLASFDDFASKLSVDTPTTFSLFDDFALLATLDWKLDFSGIPTGLSRIFFEFDCFGRLSEFLLLWDCSMADGSILFLESDFLNVAFKLISFFEVDLDNDVLLLLVFRCCFEPDLDKL